MRCSFNGEGAWRLASLSKIEQLGLKPKNQRCIVKISYKLQSLYRSALEVKQNHPGQLSSHLPSKIAYQKSS
jgi:hypothetical protein